MKQLIIFGLTLSLTAFAAKFAPNDGSARPGNPGTGISATNTETTMEKVSSDPAVQESVNRANTSVTPVPEDADDLTLKSKVKSKQSQEERVDYRTKPGISHDENHDNSDASENQ